MIYYINCLGQLYTVCTEILFSDLRGYVITLNWLMSGEKSEVWLCVIPGRNGASGQSYLDRCTPAGSPHFYWHEAI